MVYSAFDGYSASCLDRTADKGKDSLELSSALMHGFLTNLTAAALFIHAAFGCCWHHAHRERIEPGITAMPVARCCQHHHEPAADPQDGDGCEDDCEGGCQYIAPNKLCLDAQQWGASWDVVVDSFSLPEAIAAAVRSLGTGAPPHCVALPLRTHLLHQVLLI